MKKTLVVIITFLLVGGLGALVAPGISRVINGKGVCLDPTNLKQIGLACRMYANAHNGMYPDDWSQLSPYLKGYRKVFVSRHHQDRIGAMTNVMEWTDYVYVRGLTTGTPKNAVIAYLPPDGDRDGFSIIMRVDGSIEFPARSEFVTMMNKRPNRVSEATSPIGTTPQN